MTKKTVSNAFLLVFLGLECAGCNGTLATPDGSLSDTGTASRVSAVTLQSGCSVTQTASGATINCADGTSAIITSSTPQYRLRDANNVIIGRTSGYNSSSVLDADGNVSSYGVNYTTDEMVMSPQPLYFADALCATAPFTSYLSQGAIFQNFGTRYFAGAIVSTSTAYRLDPLTGVCGAISGVPGTGTKNYRYAMPYTGTLPLSFPGPSSPEQY